MFFKSKARTPSDSSKLTLDEREYALNFITKRINLLSKERFYSISSFAREDGKRFIPKNTARMHFEQQNIQGYDETLSRLETMKEKLMQLQPLNQEDLAELNVLLDKKKYRYRLAWYRILG